MIAKDSRTIAIKSLRQGKCLRDHEVTGGVIYVLNPEISGLHTPAAALPRPGRGGAEPVVGVINEYHRAA